MIIGGILLVLGFLSMSYAAVRRPAHRFEWLMLGILLWAVGCLLVWPELSDKS
jgi:hypothetical protein